MLIKTYSEPKKRIKIRNYKATDYGTQRPKTALKLQFIWPRNDNYDGAENLFGTKKYFTVEVFIALYPITPYEIGQNRFLPFSFFLLRLWDVGLKDRLKGRAHHNPNSVPAF